MALCFSERAQGFDSCGDYPCFFPVVMAAHDVDGLAALPERMACFRNAAGVVLDEAVCRRDDFRGTAVVGLQAEGFHVRVVFLEVQDVLDPCSPEGVDGLRVVSYGADVVPVCREVLDDEVLDQVRVLVFVHEDVAVALGKVFLCLRHFLQQGLHVEEDVVEVHRVGFVASGHVLAVDVFGAGDAGDLVCRGSRVVLRVHSRRYHVVLGGADAPHDPFGFVDIQERLAAFLFLFGQGLGFFLVLEIFSEEDIADAVFQA